MSPSFIANHRGQDLPMHCILVGRLAKQMIEELYVPSRAESGQGTAVLEMMKRIALTAGLLHDIGKLDLQFQSYLNSVRNAAKGTPDYSPMEGEQIAETHEKKRFSFEKYPRHEEVSWLLLSSLFDKAALKTKVLEDGSLGPANARFSRWDMLEHAIYWHHAKPLRPPGDQDDRFGDAEKLAARMSEHSNWLEGAALNDLREFLEQVQKLEPGVLDESIVSDMGGAVWNKTPTPKFKAHYESPDLLEGDDRTKSINNETHRTVIRSALVSADRIVSALSADDLEHHVLTQTLPLWGETPEGIDVFYRQIEAMVERFSEHHSGQRTDQQVDAAKDLALRSKRQGIVCLQGPAGCGKTKIALHFISEVRQAMALAGQDGAKRVFIFVPRTAIGESLFNEMVKDYGLTDRVELMTGSKKLFSQIDCPPFETTEELQGTGNLVIATIDQLCRTMLSHHQIDLISQLADSHVIFDEFHELSEIPGISLLFFEIMRLRAMSRMATLLVSATPNPHLLRSMEVEARSVIRVATFNHQPIKLKVKLWDSDVYGASAKRSPHPFTHGSHDRAEIEDGAFVVCNTATVAQTASVSHKFDNRGVICFHSKFTPRDKSRLLSQIIRTYGKNMAVEEKILIAGPIVQASLNITTRHLHTEGCHAENFLQRIGRVNRFGCMDQSQAVVYWAPKGDGLANGNELAQMNQGARTTAFYKFLGARMKAMSRTPGEPGPFEGESNLTLATLYGWYDEFHASEAAKIAYSIDAEKVLAASTKVFKNNDFDPVQVPASVMAGAKSAKGSKLSRSSLRGRSYFILPLHVKISRAGARAAVSLLWNPRSEREDVLTDELRGATFDQAIENKFFDWTRQADKPSTFSKAVAGAEGAGFLIQIAKAQRRCKKWNQMRLQSLKRESPVLVSPDKYDDNALIYLEIGDLKLGLMKANKCFENAEFSLKKALA